MKPQKKPKKGAENAKKKSFLSGGYVFWFATFVIAMSCILNAA